MIFLDIPILLIHRSVIKSFCGDLEKTKVDSGVKKTSEKPVRSLVYTDLASTAARFLGLRESSNRTGLHFTGNKYVNGILSVGCIGNVVI